MAFEYIFTVLAVIVFPHFQIVVCQGPCCILILILFGRGKSKWKRTTIRMMVGDIWLALLHYEPLSYAHGLQFCWSERTTASSYSMSSERFPKPNLYGLLFVCIEEKEDKRTSYTMFNYSLKTFQLWITTKLCIFKWAEIRIKTKQNHVSTWLVSLIQNCSWEVAYYPVHRSYMCTLAVPFA